MVKRVILFKMLHVLESAFPSFSNKGYSICASAEVEIWAKINEWKLLTYLIYFVSDVPYENTNVIYETVLTTHRICVYFYYFTFLISLVSVFLAPSPQRASPCPAHLRAPGPLIGQFRQSGR